MKTLNCTVCGKKVHKVGEKTIAVKCADCVINENLIIFGMPKGAEKKTINRKDKKPRGWHFMAEFVDQYGNIYNKGKLIAEKTNKKPTPILESYNTKKKKNKLTKRESSQEEMNIYLRIKSLKKQIKRTKKKFNIKAFEKEIRTLNKKLQELT